jgi:hypothetical protein
MVKDAFKYGKLKIGQQAVFVSWFHHSWVLCRFTPANIVSCIRNFRLLHGLLINPENSGIKAGNFLFNT